MYICHAFGMQLVFGKDRSSSGKDCSGFRNACHVALENVAQKTGGLGGHTLVLERQPES